MLKTLKTYGHGRRRHVYPSRLLTVADGVQDPPPLPSITAYIDKLIDASPELLVSPDELQRQSELSIPLSSSHTPAGQGMVFVPLPSQVRHIDKKHLYALA
jgi:hypothetical protein